MSPSKNRRKIIWDAARHAVYKNNGAEYNSNFNPFPMDSVNYKTFIRRYENWRKIFHVCESRMREMEEVYGRQPKNMNIHYLIFWIIGWIIICLDALFKEIRYCQDKGIKWDCMAYIFDSLFMFFFWPLELIRILFW